MNDRSVEIALNINPAGAVQGVDEAVRAFEDGKRRIEGLAGDMGGSFDPTSGSTPGASWMPSAGGFSPWSAPSQYPQPTTDSGIPIGGGGRLDELRSQFQTLQTIAPNAPDVANMMAGRLTTNALHASLKDPDSAREYQELIDSLRQLRGTVAEDGKKRRDDGGNLLQWLQANAMMSLGNQVMGNAQQGRLLSAAGTGIGGALGLIGGPAGMAIGASIGGGIGGFIESLAGGAGSARDYEKAIADMNQRFGLGGDAGRLRNHRLGGQFGYTAQDSAQLVDQLRENRTLDDPSQAGPMVSAIQELTRALGLNVEATAEMAGIYSRSGGEKGAEGVRGYLADVVGGAIRAGFESNVQQYADMMGSARMQSVQATGQGMSDRAFGLLQDVMGGLTGGTSKTAGLFRDNMQMAGAGLQSFMAYGGTANPYSTSAAYMRLAGISENALDSRFISPEQMAQNAQRSLGFTTNRLQQMSGMSASEFQAQAAADPNFVQGLIGGNAGLQRQTSSIVSGFIGREATAQDLRTYEQLTNLSAANGGQLPTGNSAGGRQVEELLKQLQASPADEMRQKEAEAQNATLAAMSNFMNIQTRLDQWMADILNWSVKNVDLKAVEKIILDAMTCMEKAAKWMADRLPEIRVRAVEAFEAMKKAAGDVGEFIGSVRNSRVGKMLFGDGESSGAIRQGAAAYGDAMQNPMLQRGIGIMGRLGIDAVLPGARQAAGLARGVHDLFNDTPGSVTATPGYNTFNFAPGDVITARQGGISGGATLTDLNLTLIQSTVLGAQWHKENQEQRGLLQDVTEKVFETIAKTQADLETAVTKQFPGMIDLLGNLVKSSAVRDGLLAKIEQHFPTAIAAIGAVQNAIAMMGMGAGGTGGGAGGALGAFASGLFTGPRANIGGSSPNHIDTKISRDLSWEQIDELFMQMAQGYASDNRRIEFSNRAVAGQVYDPNAPQSERIDLLRRAAAAHASQARDRAAGVYSFDYYVPQGNDPRSEAANSSSAGAEIMLPTLPGGNVTYGTAQNYGNFATIRDADGRVVLRTGHGDNRRALPQGRSFPTAAAAGGGGALSLGQGYESLQALSGELASRDPRFDPSTPEGRAAQVLALGIGGSEVYSRGSTDRDFFTRMGGTNRAMRGFAQFHTGYHNAETDTPGEYVDFLGDILTGQRAQPNGRQGRNWAGELSRAVQGGQISTGAQLEQWMRRQGLGGSNWQGVDDGWGRVPGLSDQLLRQLQGGGGGGPRASAGGNIINVNIAMNGSNLNPGDVERAARTGVETAAVDEFELRRGRDRNPRNTQPMSPVYS